MMPAPFSFVVTAYDDGDTVLEFVVEGMCDRWPKGPGDLSWYPTRVLTADGVCSLSPQVLDLFPEKYIEERVLDALLWLETDKPYSWGPQCER